MSLALQDLHVDPAEADVVARRADTAPCRAGVDAGRVAADRGDDPGFGTARPRLLMQEG